MMLSLMLFASVADDIVSDGLRKYITGQRKVIFDGIQT